MNSVSSLSKNKNMSKLKVFRKDLRESKNNKRFSEKVFQSKENQMNKLKKKWNNEKIVKELLRQQEN